MIYFCLNSWTTVLHPKMTWCWPTRPFFMLVPWRTRSHRHAQAIHTASLQCSTQVTALLIRVPPTHFPLCFTTCQMNRVCFRAMDPTPVGLRGTCSTLLSAETGDNCSHCLIKLQPGHRKSVWALNPGRAFTNFWRPFVSLWCCSWLAYRLQLAWSRLLCESPPFSLCIDREQRCPDLAASISLTEAGS